MVVLYSVLLLLAMTVQTGTVSMILCVLAFLSLLGKKPLSRFEQRLSVPVLGLLAFAVIYGAAAIHSPFGASAQTEFYKFIAAFSLTVILLARFERKHVPGLLWGGASVSAVIALISLDMSCGQVLFWPFNALMNALGTDYASALPEYFSARVNGLYNDANVTASLFALALFAALYLAARGGISAGGRQRREPSAHRQPRRFALLCGVLHCLACCGADRPGRSVPPTAGNSRDHARRRCSGLLHGKRRQ